MEPNLASYRRAADPLPSAHWTWPLHGEGLEALGQGGAPVLEPLPTYEANELLVRHDAVGLCFSDLKIIQMGSRHPRLGGRDLAANPLLPGHEVSLTVVGVGARLRDRYRPAMRFTVQPDVWYRQRSVPYGYTLPGALQQYGVISKEILQGDAGCYLIPVPDGLTYAGAALTEPWACVEAAYRVEYRTALRDQGTVWFLGGQSARRGYRLGRVWPSAHPPAEVVMTHLPSDLASRVRALCGRAGTELRELDADKVLSADLRFDDILLLDGSAEQVDSAAALLSPGGILAIAREGPMMQPIHIDLGRLHYDHIVYVGTTSSDLDAAYQATPVRSTLAAEGTLWVLGAGGPMGRMHVQRAIEGRQAPRRIVGTELDAARAGELEASFAAPAQQQGIKLEVLDPRSAAAYRGAMAEVVADGGVTDVQVMAAIPSVVAQASQYLSTGAVVSLFAGVARGVTAPIDPWLIYGPRQVRFIGHSGSALAHQVAIVQRASAGELNPDRSVAAIAGLRQVADGLGALAELVYAGKIVVYPAVLDFPLTALPHLQQVLPTVYTRLENRSVWTAAAEAAFLEAMLPG